MSTVADGLSSAEVTRRVGISYKQLNYWHGLHLVRPGVHEAKGSGDNHRWSEDDVRLLRVVGALTALGLGIDVCRRALPLVREPDGCRWLLIGCGGREIAVVAETHLEESLATVGGTATVVDLAVSESVHNSTKSQGYAPIAPQGDAATVAP